MGGHGSVPGGSARSISGSSWPAANFVSRKSAHRLSCCPVDVIGFPASSLDLNVLCLTETYSSQKGDSLTIYSDQPPSDDSWAEVALVLNQRLSRFQKRYSF